MHLVNIVSRKSRVDGCGMWFIDREQIGSRDEGGIVEIVIKVSKCVEELRENSCVVSLLTHH